MLRYSGAVLASAAGKMFVRVAPHGCTGFLRLTFNFMQEPQCPRGNECVQLSQAEADYNRLFNLSPDLLCVAGLDGFFKRVNPSWTRILGWSEAELLSRPVESFMHPDDRERTLQARSDLAKGLPVRGLENRYLCKDGSHRWLAWQSVVEPPGTTVFAVARDITERRQWDQEQLVRSKLESTGILAAGIAHDFNNLLASLLLNVEMVSLCDSTSAEQENYLSHARTTIHAATALTQQLITFSAGGQPARHVADLKVLLEQSMEVALRGSALRGKCDVAPDLWAAEVDEGQLGQVMRNLILNAREASQPGGTVRLTAANVVLESVPVAGCPPGEYLRIDITDDGVGIPADILPNVFDPYFSTKERGSQKGMGLGLTICRIVLQKHGGTMAIASHPGVGTTVTCYLPALQRKTFEIPAVAHPDAGGEPRVLVMDDEELFRETLAQALQRLGYLVEQAGDGETAVALYQQEMKAGRPFAAVLLDLTVRGGMGGTETMKALQACDPGVRAVLITGYSNEEAFREHARHGFRGALGKPFSSESLRTLLGGILRTDLARAKGGYAPVTNTH